MKRLSILAVLAVLCMSSLSYAQFASTGTTTLSVTVGTEAAIRIDTSATTLATSGGNFGNPYTGTTNFTYKVRTTQSGGSGAITLKVTTDFDGTGGPKVTPPPTAGDALTYSCTKSGVGTACTGPLTASTATDTNVVTFGANAKSAIAGDTGSVAWSLTNDPAYATGTYTATVTFTVSAA
jgi:opacity protein-like surface antigen